MSLTATLAGAKTVASLIPYAGMTAALVFGGIQWMNASHWNKRYVAEDKAHTSTKTEYRLAQALAEINALNAATQERDRYATLAMKATTAHETLNSANTRFVADFLRREAARRAPSQTDLPGAAAMPAGSVQPADEAVVSSGDLYSIGSAYAQCDSLIDWARGLGDDR